MGLNRICLAASLVAAIGFISPGLAADKANAVLKDAKGNEVGQVTLITAPSGVLLSADLTTVPAGDHGFHIHAVGKCEPPDFKSAGDHFNPDKTEHGLLNPKGPHAGDMPNIHVPDSGKFKVEILNPMVTLDKESALLDEDGSAIVIHAMPDDYKSDPTGHAGDRIACGVITP
jgi:Cu-Zn family superoxide dismutase